MLVVQTLDMHSGWNEALPLTLLNLYDALLSGNLDLRVRLRHRHDNQNITLRRLLHLSGRLSSLLLCVFNRQVVLHCCLVATLAIRHSIFFV